jgi:hypothetical protein
MSPDTIAYHSQTNETTMSIINHKGEISAGATAVAGAVTWLDMLQGFLEWGVLVFGFIAGGFAVYWNVNRCMEKRRNDRKSK